MEKNIIELLKRSRLFAETDFNKLEAELTELSIKDLLPGDVLLDPIQLNSNIYVVLTGELIVSPDLGDAAPLARLRSGECVGEVSIIDDQPPSAYVVAATASSLLDIPQRIFWRMMEKMPQLALNMLVILADRFRQNNVVLLESLEMQRRYRDLSETDLLTGLHNRSWCMDVFPKQLDLCERIGQPIALALLDIDHFKQVNDQYGHAEGDTVLKVISRAIDKNLRRSDLLARYGGEEFIVMMPSTPISGAVLTMERLRESIGALPIRLEDGHDITCTISIGVAALQRGIRFDELVSFADQALYQAKDEGRNRVVERRRPVGKESTDNVKVPV